MLGNDTDSEIFSAPFTPTVGLISGPTVTAADPLYCHQPAEKTVESTIIACLRAYKANLSVPAGFSFPDSCKTTKFSSWQLSPVHVFVLLSVLGHSFGAHCAELRSFHLEEKMGCSLEYGLIFFCFVETNKWCLNH